jgi:hypothetical protein
MPPDEQPSPAGRDEWEGVDPSRRRFLQRFVATAFVAPVVASFGLDGIAAATEPTQRHPNQRCANQTMPNQTIPNQTMPNQTMPNQRDRDGREGGERCRKPRKKRRDERRRRDDD